MEICDRHFQKGEYCPGTKKITSSSHESFDLCEACYAEFTAFLNPPKQVPEPVQEKQERKTSGSKRTRKVTRKAKK